MTKDPPEEYRDSIETAVRNALEDEKVWVGKAGFGRRTNRGYSDEQAWTQIKGQLQDSRLLEYKEYSLELFRKWRYEDVQREHEKRTK